jgi:ubiquinone biosynthesis protein UbiJ
MRMIVVFMASLCLVLGCESKPQEATEVPEDLMREIAMDAARDTIKIDGPAILMMEARDAIQQQARQAAAETARQVAADECRKVLDQAQLQQMEAQIKELQQQVHQLQAALAKILPAVEPSK